MRQPAHRRPATASVVAREVAFALEIPATATEDRSVAEEPVSQLAEIRAVLFGTFASTLRDFRLAMSR